jgi:hypothetical protein
MLIGNVPLRDLTAHDVRRTLNKLAEARWRGIPEH